MESEVDLFYFKKILPEIKFTSEDITKDFKDKFESKLFKNVTFREVKSLSGNSFFTITGPRASIAKISRKFANVLTDSSIKFQESYNNLAKTFLKNNWWHPKMDSSIGGNIPNPEKIFAPSLCQAIDEKDRDEALKEMQRIKSELIPEDSVLALPSPFIFETEANESDMTYLVDFMSEKFLVPNISLNSINGVDISILPEEIRNGERKLIKSVACGLMTDDTLNSGRGLLEFPDLPKFSTIILSDLELNI